MTHSYFVVMRDFGRRGLEAIVDPEITYSGMIDRMVSGEWNNIVFVHEVRDDGERIDATNITEDVAKVVWALQMQAAE